MTKKSNGEVKAGNIAKANGKAKVKVDRVAERRSFIKQNSTAILKAWNDLKEKKSAAALNRALPKGWRNKWIDEVLMLTGLRKSGEDVVIKAVAEDKEFLKDIVVPRKAEVKPSK